MTIIEYAKKLGFNLNAAQITILNEYEKYKKDNNIIINYPRFSGRGMINDIIDKYNSYQEAISDMIPFVNEIISLCKEDDEFEDDGTVLKEVLCRKLLKYGFIEMDDNNNYILNQLELKEDNKNDKN